MRIKAEILPKLWIWERDLKGISWPFVHKKQLVRPLGLKEETRPISGAPSSDKATQSLTVQSELFCPKYLAHEVCSMWASTDRSLLKS